MHASCLQGVCTSNWQLTGRQGWHVLAEAVSPALSDARHMCIPIPLLLACSAAALCWTAVGPLQPTGTTVLCSRAVPGRPAAASPKKGRYVSVEMTSTLARPPKVQLALAEVVIYARGEPASHIQLEGGRCR